MLLVLLLHHIANYVALEKIPPTTSPKGAKTGRYAPYHIPVPVLRNANLSSAESSIHWFGESLWKPRYVVNKDWYAIAVEMINYSLE